MRNVKTMYFQSTQVWHFNNTLSPQFKRYNERKNATINNNCNNYKPVAVKNSGNNLNNKRPTMYKTVPQIYSYPSFTNSRLEVTCSNFLTTENSEQG